MAVIKQKNRCYKDYYKLNDDKRYEVIEGELIEPAPAPRYKHQNISKHIFLSLNSYVVEKKCGVVQYAPLDIIFDEHNVLQPDIVFISNENKGIIQDKGVFGSPDCVVEILSPSAKNKDKVTKFALYERFKVQEYWIVDPEAKSIEVFSLESNKYKLLSRAKDKDELISKLFANIEMNIKQIFN